MIVNKLKLLYGLGRSVFGNDADRGVGDHAALHEQPDPHSRQARRIDARGYQAVLRCR
jgi:hypothetical protein